MEKFRHNKNKQEDIMYSIRRLGTFFCFALTGPLSPAFAGDLQITIEDRKQVSAQDTVIEVIGSSTGSITTREVEITQLDQEFSPDFSVISKGSSVLFSNDDPFQHHVYSVSKDNQFDLPLYQDKPARLIEFDNHGVVKLGCNIHDWMLAFIYVSESPNLAITDASGIAHFSGLPAGEYQIRIWNPRFRNNKKTIAPPISVTATGTRKATVEVSLRKKIRKPERPKNNGGYINSNR